MRGSIFGALALVAGLTLPVADQVHDRDLVVEHCGYIELPVRSRANTVHEPYTTKYIVSSQPLQKDGTTKYSESTVVFIHGLQGRWMNSITVAPSPEEESPRTYVCVYDP